MPAVMNFIIQNKIVGELINSDSIVLKNKSMLNNELIQPRNFLCDTISETIISDETPENAQKMQFKSLSSYCILTSHLLTS